MPEQTAPTILIVDDEEEIANLLDNYVTSMGDYNTIKTNSGKEALEIIKQTIPDLVLLDIMMDDIEGTAVCQAIKADDKTSHIPVIAVTVIHRVNKKRFQEIIDSGVDDFVEKPFGYDELKKILNKHLPKN